jgi:hypothetical protein
MLDDDSTNKYTMIKEKTNSYFFCTDTKLLTNFMKQEAWEADGPEVPLQLKQAKRQSTYNTRSSSGKRRPTPAATPPTMTADRIPRTASLWKVV